MSDIWLSPDEVKQLTAKTRWSAQCKALTAMGLRFIPNAVGRPLVERAAVLHAKPQAKPKRQGPDFSSLMGAV